MPDITPKDYDKDIIKEGEEFQIKNYYVLDTLPRKRRVEYVLSSLNIERGVSVLDLGCGVGSFAYFSALAGAEAYGVDYSEESIKMAEKLCKKFNVSAKFVVADIVKGLPYKNDHFDRVVAADFIEHLTDEEKEKVLCEIKRVLKPEGRAVIFTPNKIREDIGKIKGQIMGTYRENPLHFGLISRRGFEKMMNKQKLKFDFCYYDVVRPYLASLPVIRGALALNLLWIVKK